MVDAAFSNDGAGFATGSPLMALSMRDQGGGYVQNHVHVPDAAAAADAAELLARFGPFAVSEAAARADESRALGNVVAFCRWRQIERLIGLMEAGGAGSTIH